MTKKGFYPRKDKGPILYAKYYLVPGLWIGGTRPVKCWATFTPNKQYLGCYTNFLDAKDKVKSHKIEKIMTSR